MFWEDLSMESGNEKKGVDENANEAESRKDLARNRTCSRRHNWLSFGAALSKKLLLLSSICSKSAKSFHSIHRFVLAARFLFSVSFRFTDRSLQLATPHTCVRSQPFDAGPIMEIGPPVSMVGWLAGCPTRNTIYFLLALWYRKRAAVWEIFKTFTGLHGFSRLTVVRDVNGFLGAPTRW